MPPSGATREAPADRSERNGGKTKSAKVAKKAAAKQVAAKPTSIGRLEKRTSANDGLIISICGYPP
jgi:hypothetical protein